MADFDIRALHAALDTERTTRDMSWADVAREISRATGGAVSISPSTLSGMHAKRVVEADGVLQALRWLGRTPESFVPGHVAAPGEDAMLRALEPGTLLRFDAKKIHLDLDSARRERGLTWVAVANEIGGLGPSGLTRLAAGGRVAFPEIMRVFRWLRRPAAHYTRTSTA
jgi:hypothetical protein